MSKSTKNLVKEAQKYYEENFYTPYEISKMKKEIKEDVVNKPSHYTDGNIEVIDFIEDKKLGFHLGNTVKYISRAGKKDPNKYIEDLEKAEWYLKRKIQKLKNEIHNSTTRIKG